MQHASSCLLLTHLAASPQRFCLRWFTPKVEVDLCGHATLATSGILCNEVGNKASQYVPCTLWAAVGSSAPHHSPTRCFGTFRFAFTTRSGELFARAGPKAAMQLEFPRNVAHQVRLVGAVRQVVQHVVGNLPVHEVLHDPVTRKLIVRLHDEVSVAELKVSRRWRAVPLLLYGARLCDTLLSIGFGAQGVQPDFAAMLAVDQSRLNPRILGVSVTLRGVLACTSLQTFVLTRTCVCVCVLHSIWGCLSASEQRR